MAASEALARALAGDDRRGVLAEYSEAELAAVLRVGAGRGPESVVGASGAATAAYKEAQIHGPVDLARDVDAVVGIRGLEDSPAERAV